MEDLDLNKNEEIENEEVLENDDIEALKTKIASLKEENERLVAQLRRERNAQNGNENNKNDSIHKSWNKHKRY